MPSSVLLTGPTAAAVSSINLPVTSVQAHTQLPLLLLSISLQMVHGHGTKQVMYRLIQTRLFYS